MDPRDEMDEDLVMRVFFNDQDSEHKKMILCVQNHRDQRRLNAANRIHFHMMQDMPAVMAEESPLHKYFMLYNPATSSMSKGEALRLVDTPESRQANMKMLLVQSEGVKPEERTDPRIKKVFFNEQAAAEWLCGVTVNEVRYKYCVPHVLIDRDTAEYEYFLKKYSSIFHRFTYKYIADKEELKQEITAVKGREFSQVWIIVKDAKSLADYWKVADRLDNGKQVRFIV